MENKKSNSANLEKSRKSFLLIGVAVATAFVLMAFEWSTISYKQSLEAKNDDESYTIPFTAPDEIIMLIDEEPKPVAKKEFNNEVVEVTEKIEEVVEEIKEDIVEDIIVPPLTGITKDNPSNKREPNLIEPGELIDPDEPIPMGPTVKVPYYDYCIDQSHEEKIACISKEIHKSINKGLTNITAYQIETNKAKKMYVQFVIGKDGLIQDLKIAGEENFNKAIVKMVKNSMSKVPQMHPALLHGKPVSVYFSIPINFNVQ